MENDFLLISEFRGTEGYYIVKKGDYSRNGGSLYILSSIGKFRTIGDRAIEIFPETIHGIFIHTPVIYPLPDIYFRKLLEVYHEVPFKEDVLPYLIGGRIL